MLSDKCWLESGLVGYYLVGDGCADQVAVAMLKKIGDEDRARNIIRRWTGVVYVMKSIFPGDINRNRKTTLELIQGRRSEGKVQEQKATFQVARRRRRRCRRARAVRKAEEG